MRRRTWVFAIVAAVLLVAGALPGWAVPSCREMQTSSTCQSTCLGAGYGGCMWFWAEGCTYQYFCQHGQISGPCSCATGCFLAGTQITMADGTTKPIEQIAVGDVVLAYDKATGEMKPDPVKRLHEPFTADSYLLVNGRLRITPTQPVFSDGRWLDMGDLRVGDTLTAANGSAVKIESLEVVEGPVTVYNFDVNPFETFVADGFIVHRKQTIVEGP